MIRYSIDIRVLEAVIDAERPNWRANNLARLPWLLSAKAFSGPENWSEIKPVFMRLQNNKCAYCETKLQAGAIAHDLEHFRPKNSVKNWRRRAHGGPVVGAIDLQDGYYWLAYDIENYAAACKICNTNLKSNYFPVRGARGVAGSTVTQLAAEDQLLCYPIGEADEDPASLMTFDATIAIPTPGANQAQRERAETIIEFFKLNEREDLQHDRAQMIVLIAPYLERLVEGTASAADLMVIGVCLSGQNAHTACCRAFVETWHADQGRAIAIWDACKLAMVASPLSPNPI